MTPIHYSLIAISLILGSLMLALKGEAPTTTDLPVVTTEDSIEATEDFAYEIDSADYVKGHDLIATLPTSELTPEETEDILYMREEEKLAHDVYMALSRRWGIQTFANIAESEQTHTDAVLTLIERYDLTDRASAEEGVFSNETLQNLYNNLLAEGTASRAAALTVGARIEDLDIKDLDAAIARTDNEDIALVYSNLRRGSENHLRAFNKQLVRETGENYTPEFITAEEFEAIISSSSGQGMGGNGGNRGGRGMGGNNR